MNKNRFEKYANKKGHHIEQVELVMSSIEKYGKNIEMYNNFVCHLQPNISKLNFNYDTYIDVIAKYIIETMEKECDTDEDFICRGSAYDFIRGNFKHIYEFSKNGGITEKCTDYIYVLKIYMQHIANEEGRLFLNNHKLPPNVFNTLIDIKKELNI